MFRSSPYTSSSTTFASPRCGQDGGRGEWLEVPVGGAFRQRGAPVVWLAHTTMSTRGKGVVLNVVGRGPPYTALCASQGLFLA